MPYKDPIKRKAYHKKYSSDWEKKANRWGDPKRRAYCKSRFVSLSQMQYARLRNYNMSQEEYDDRVKKQNNLCALCGRPETHIHYKTKKAQSLSVDHDHETGKNRDLLCGDCNRGIGLFEENIELLSKVIEYLKKHKGINNG